MNPQFRSLHYMFLEGFLKPVIYKTVNDGEISYKALIMTYYVPFTDVKCDHVEGTIIRVSVPSKKMFCDLDLEDKELMNKYGAEFHENTNKQL